MRPVYARQFCAEAREASLPPGYLSDPCGNGFGRSLEWPFSSSRYLTESAYRQRVRHAALHNRLYAVNWYRATMQRMRELDVQLLPRSAFNIHSNRPRRRTRRQRRKR